MLYINYTMDKRLTLKLNNYICKFKDDIKKEVLTMQCLEKDKIVDFLSFLYEYEQLEITRNDFLKRKRVKNTIPNDNRCNALKAGGHQCTRRRKENCLYCGTHVKGSPHGEVSENKDNSTKIIEITATQISGIIYYIDDIKNVYKMEDVLAGKEDPTIIGTYKKENDEIIINEN